jgi:hypothetical protein
LIEVILDGSLFTAIETRGALTPGAEQHFG